MDEQSEFEYVKASKKSKKKKMDIDSDEEFSADDN